MSASGFASGAASRPVEPLEPREEFEKLFGAPTTTDETPPAEPASIMATQTTPPATDDEPPWLATPVSALDLPKNAIEALAEATLVTVRDVLLDVRDHGPLTRHKGISEPTAKAIQEAIGKLATT